MKSSPEARVTSAFPPLLRRGDPGAPPWTARFASILVATLVASFATIVGAGVSFPDTLTLRESNVDHELRLTGQDERVVLIFSVYDIAHYVDVGHVAAPETPLTIVEDGPAKAIAIRFSRRLGRDRVRKELRKTIRINAEAAWLDDAKDTVERFIGAIDRDAHPGDQLVYYWLEGGRLLAEFNGERFFAATDMSFAKLIWSIWFGDQPVCDPDQLLARLALEADA